MKYRITGVIVIMAIMLCGLPMAVMGEEMPEGATPVIELLPAESEDQQEQEPQPAPENILVIDNSNAYEGMDKPYKNGYMPSAAGGVAKVILPITSTLEIKDNRIHVSYDLGDAQSSPFQFGNYDQTIKRGTHKTGGGKSEAFLIHIDLPLTANRVMGRYPVVMKAHGSLVDGTAFAQDFTIFVTITDGIDPNAPELHPEQPPETGGSGSEPAPVPQPKIMLSGYSVNPSPVVAGQIFHLSATLLNTNEKQSLDNVMISIVGMTTELLPSGSDTGNFYFEKIGKGESVTLEMDMVASPNSKPEPQKLIISVEYEGNKATAYTANEEIVIPVSQPIRLEYDEPQIPQEVNAGDTISVSLNVMNLGIGSVHNVRLSLEASGLIPDKTAFLGNIASGEAKKGDLHVFVGTKDMAESSGSVSQDEKYGHTAGVMTLDYEDEYGQKYTEEFEFTTNINPPVTTAPEETEIEEEPKRQKQWWISIIIAGAVIAAILIIRAYIMKKRERQDHEDE